MMAHRYSFLTIAMSIYVPHIKMYSNMIIKVITQAFGIQVHWAS